MFKIISAIAIHLFLVLAFYFLLLDAKVMLTVPDNINLLNWDTKWYNLIKENGYVFKAYEPCNMAFFPFFPYFWRWIDLSAMGISIMNLSIFLSAVYFLLKEYKISTIFSLFILAIPSLMFMAVPYSESLFFAFSTLLIIGYKKNNTTYKIIGFLGSSLIRSVSIIFIPAIIITEVLIADKNLPFAQRIKNILPGLISCITGFIFSAAVQFYQTGKLFYFLEIQKYWRRGWNMPNFPLTTYSPDRMLGVDGLAFCLGFLGFALVIWWGYSLVIKKMPLSRFSLEPAVIFSVLYIVGTTVLDTVFTFDDNGATSIWSLNRHIFSTPFLIVFIIYLVYEIKPSSIEKMAGFGIVLICIFLTGVFRFYGLTIFYVLFFFSLFIFKYHPESKHIVILFYVLSLYIQLTFYHDFLNYQWIG